MRNHGAHCQVRSVSRARDLTLLTCGALMMLVVGIGGVTEALTAGWIV